MDREAGRMRFLQNFNDQLQEAIGTQLLAPLDGEMLMRPESFHGHCGAPAGLRRISAAARALSLRILAAVFLSCRVSECCCLRTLSAKSPSCFCFFKPSSPCTFIV